jgi:ureidoacrylate peracid hydrolase
MVDSALPTVVVPAEPGPVTVVPARTAVVVVDMQNDFGHPQGMFGRAGIDLAGIRATVAPTRQVLDAARQAGILVVYLKMAFRRDLSDAGPTTPTWVKHLPMHAGEDVVAPDGSPSRVLVRDTWNTEIIDELTPVAGDVVFYKHRYSGFFGTDLDNVLRARGVTTLVFTGCTTSVCVESTVRDAMFRDYDCLLLEDCVAEPIGADAARSNHEASLLVVRLLLGWVSTSAGFLQALQGAASRALSA